MLREPGLIRRATFQSVGSVDRLGARTARWFDAPTHRTRCSTRPILLVGDLWYPFAMILAVRVPPGNDCGPLHMDQVLSAMHRGSAPVNLSFARTRGSVGLFCRVPDAEARSA